MRESFALFVDAQWHWVSAGLGGAFRQGIMRGELEAAARMTDIAITPAIFQDIRIMEEEALKTWAKKKR